MVHLGLLHLRKKEEGRGREGGGKGGGRRREGGGKEEGRGREGGGKGEGRGREEGGKEGFKEEERRWEGQKVLIRRVQVNVMHTLASVPAPNQPQYRSLVM